MILNHVKLFEYLESIMQENGGISEEIANETLPKMTEVMCDEKISLNVKGKFNKAVVKLATMYRSKCFNVKIRKKK